MHESVWGINRSHSRGIVCKEIDRLFEEIRKHTEKIEAKDNQIVELNRELMEVREKNRKHLIEDAKRIGVFITLKRWNKIKGSVKDDCK